MIENLIIDSRYKVLEEIGTGVWAKTYKVEDIRTGNIFSLKLFDQLSAHDFYEKFSAEEMHRITQLEHPGLVPVITFGNMDNHIYCVFEHYKGQPLTNFIFKINRINIVYDLIVQCLYALNSLHSQNIYHEDIKPSNILYHIIDNSIEVKFIDYGFNKIDTDKNQQTVSSTLPYVAPELLMKGSPSPQSDLYSLGVTLYKLTTGNLPFSLEQITSIFHGNQSNFFPKFIREINPEITAGLEKFIMKLLEKNPNDRFSDAQSAIAFINKIQNKKYPFSQRTSLVQSVRFNSYIVRSNYTHQLLDHVQSIVKGGGKLVSLIGGDGIGKNTLLNLFKYYFFTNEYFIFDYTCSSEHQDPFYALIKEFSSSILSNAQNQTIYDKLSTRFKIFIEQTEEIANTFQEDSKKLKNDYKIADNFIDSLASVKPIIFIIREAEFLTKESIKFINYISPTINKKPILIVVSSNNPSKIKDIIYTVQTRIAPLSIEETDKYIQNILNATPDKEFVQNILYRSAGNPFFIREILVDLLNKNFLIKNDVINFDIDFDKYILPDYLVSSIFNRMGHLEDTSYEHLQKLAIVHTPITKKLIKALLNISDKPLFDLIRDALDNEIFIEKDDGYAFCFPESKQRLFNECSTQLRTKISKKLIAYYEKYEEPDLAICKGIIQNATLCKDYDAIKKYRMRMVSIYSAEYDQVNAFHEICKIIDLNFSGKIKVSEDELSKDLMVLVEKSDLTGYLYEAIELLLKYQNQTTELFEWYYSIAYIYFRVDNIDTGYEYIQLAQTKKYNDEQKIRLMIAQATISNSLGKNAEAEKLFETLLTFKLSPEHDVIFRDRYGNFLYTNRKEEEAINWYEESILLLEKSSELQNSTRLCLLYNNLGILYSNRKSYKEAEKLFFKSKAQSEKINYHRILGTVYNNIGDLALKQGDTITAFEYFKKAEEISIKINNIPSLALTYNNFGETNIKLGNFVEAEEYLLQAKDLMKNNETHHITNMINNNLALSKNKIINFYHFYKFLEENFKEITENRITKVTPMVKSYLFFLYETGNKASIESILYNRLNFSETLDEDFYYQILAFMSIFKKDYISAIVNFKQALDCAKKTMSSYSISIVYIYLAMCYCYNNEPDKANECLDYAEPLIKEKNYFYWDIFKNITRLKVAFIKSEIPLRNILREAFVLLPITIERQYFLLEIELYTIIIQIFIEFKANRYAQKYYKIYSESVRNAVRYLPNELQNNYLAMKKITLKNINDFSFFFIANRKQLRQAEWNNEILPLLRLEETERIKFFLIKKVKEYFAPASFGIFIFNANNLSYQSITMSNYRVYIEENFDVSILEQKEIALNIKNSIEKGKSIPLTIDEVHYVIFPVLLKHSKIGFGIFHDNGEMPFLAQEVKMIDAFSFYLSTMLIRMAEFDEVNQKIYLMQKLMDITNNMMQTYNIEKLEYDFIYNIINIIDATRGFLIKRDKQGNYFFSVAIDKENNLLSNVSHFSKSAVSEVISSKHPIFIENTFNDLSSRLFNDSTDLQANSIYCAPIIIDNEIYGVLYLDNFGSDKSYLKINIEMMEMFLAQASLALNNAKTYQSLMTKNWELHTLDTMKNDFIAIVSHELNTPLITLQGYVTKLKKNMTLIDPDSNELLSKVENSTKRLINSIQDIMTLNRYNVSTKLNKIKTDISEILKKVLEDITALSKNRKMKFKLEIEDDLPSIEVESQALTILIMNLMMNAVRFTADYGTIILGVRRATFPHEKINEAETLLIYIQDNGIGIPENEQENIFKTFYELGDIYSHRSGFLEFRSGGLGIGLAIAKRIVDLHGGKIWLKSKEREGTTAFVSLPV